MAYFRAPVPWHELIRRTVTETLEDNCVGLAAQLAFYFFLALFPALLFLISLLSYVPVEGALSVAFQRVEGVLPEEVLTLIRRELEALAQATPRGLLTFAVAGALWSSSSAVTAIISTLNHAFDIEEWRPWWKTRLVAVGLSIWLALFTVAALMLVVGGRDVAAAVASWMGAGELFARVWGYVQWGLAILLVVFAVDLVYYFAPNAETRWVWISPGSLLATGLWLLTSLGFRLYLEHVGSVTLVQGAIGSVVVLLLWFYLSGLALLIGAELNSEIDNAMPTRDTAPQGPHRRKRIGPAAEGVSGAGEQA